MASFFFFFKETLLSSEVDLVITGHVSGNNFSYSLKSGPESTLDCHTRALKHEKASESSLLSCILVDMRCPRLAGRLTCPVEMHISACQLCDSAFPLYLANLIKHKRSVVRDFFEIC